MQAAKDEFKERVADVGAYLDFLAALETRVGGEIVDPGVDQQCLQVMKASAFLLLYNIIESTVTSSFQHIYDEVAANSIPYDLLSKDLQEVWWSQQLGKLSSDSANRDTYLRCAKRLGNAIYAGDSVTLDARSLPISGSLEAEKIRQLCKVHGITLKVERQALGGAELKTVKDKRNSLAHGLVSFSECGRDYTVADLKRISDQVITFLRSLIASVEGYSKRSGYFT